MFQRYAKPMIFDLILLIFEPYNGDFDQNNAYTHAYSGPLPHLDTCIVHVTVSHLHRLKSC